MTMNRNELKVANEAYEDYLKADKLADEINGTEFSQELIDELVESPLVLNIVLYKGNHADWYEIELVNGDQVELEYKGN